MDNKTRRSINEMSNENLLLYYYKNKALLSVEEQVFIEKEIQYRTGIEDKKPDTIHSKSYITTFIILILIMVLLTLPFHYIPSRFMVFPKDNFNLSYTIITENDIDELVKRYDNASFIEKITIRNEPLFRKLMEKGIIVEKGLFDNN